jgi:hypothetical protein
MSIYKYFRYLLSSDLKTFIRFQYELCSMGRVYHEECPHCGEDLEILAPRKGMKSFWYICPYCQYKFDVLRDEEDVIRVATRAEKAIRAVLWGIVIVFILWILWFAFVSPNEPEPERNLSGKLLFDANIAGEVYINDVYMGRMQNKQVPFNAIGCETIKVRVEYEGFEWEKYVNACDIIPINKDYVVYIIDEKKPE